MRKAIVLCDVDGTILDENYQLTDDLKEVVSELKNNRKLNLLIGLNSDSSLLSLRKWGKEWGFSGPFVAELGGVIGFKGRKIYLREKKFWQNFRERVIKRLQLDSGRRGDFSIVVGDPVEWIKRWKGVGFENHFVILINAFREVSFSCTFRLIKNGKLVIDKGFFSEMSDEILRMFFSINGGKEALIDANLQYGILLIHQKGASKKEALDVVKRLFSNRKIFMIGNSMSDYLGDEVVHCAVNNATDEFKAKCRCVAPDGYTKGVGFLLEWVTTQIRKGGG